METLSHYSHALTGQEDTFTPEVAGFSLARIIFVQAEELGLKGSTWKTSLLANSSTYHCHAIDTENNT